MTKKADIGGKRLIGLSPTLWAHWVTNDDTVQVQEMLNSELQWIERESDILLKAYSPQWGDFILLNELQLRYDARMPWRMRAYAGLVEEKYGLPVYPVVVNILRPGPTITIANRYESNIMGITAHQDYRVINLWEIEAEVVFAQNLSSLLPFVPILKGGDSENSLRQALVRLRNDEVLADLEPLLSFFASFVFDIPLVQQMMRWDMTVLQESPWYNQILQEGLQKGRQEGIQEGLQKGEADLLIRQLKRRLGLLSEDQLAQIRQLPISQLENLGEALLDFTDMADLEQYLEP
jgi:predicted transposase YdaD